MNKPKTYDDFLEKYTRVPNHIDLNASWDGCMLETFGPEVNYVCEVANNKDTQRKVWTIIEGDDDSLWVVAGYHHVNRQGFFITEEDWEDAAEEYEVFSAEEMDELHRDCELGGEG